MNELIGRIIAGRYRVDAFLGKGGMAEVYKVWDQHRSAYLAMKILHADLAEDKVFLRRFRREAQTLSKLQHPNIVRFYGLEQDADLVFILMDYVEGTTLRKEIFQSKGPFSMERILEILRPVCAALYYAHKSGFVHCDVKPANIMIHKNGTIYVSDFGIARMTEAATMTMVGAGTPAYMAPEQARGEEPTPQTDIYTLGVVLFEMLTGGERPFTGENAKTTGSTTEKIRWEQMRLTPPPPSKFNSSITSEINAIVLKCLEKSTTSRYLSAMDLLNELTRQLVQTEKPVPAIPPSTSPPLPKHHRNNKRHKPKHQLPSVSSDHSSIPAVAPSGRKERKPVPKMSNRQSSRSLKAFTIVSIGLVSILTIIAVSLGVTYQRNVNVTATANAKIVQATATKAAQNKQAIATKQALNANETATKQASNQIRTATARSKSTSTARSKSTSTALAKAAQTATVRAYGNQIASMKIIIDAEKAWVKTGINVLTEDWIVVEQVSGSWSVDPNNFEYVNANGYIGSLTPKFFCYWCAAPIRGGILGKLVARIGQSTEPVGISKIFQASQNGILMLMINDAYDSLHDNDGSLWVTITVYRP